MGAGANSSQNKELNEKAERAAGRQGDRGPAQEAIEDSQGKPVDRTQTAGAFGKEGQANADAGGQGLEGGGGGGASPDSRIPDVGAAKRKAH